MTNTTTMSSKRPTTRLDVSITMPVYNAGQWLRPTLDSIINQKTQYSYNVIAINDGSTDNSLDILREYQQRYPNLIHIIDQSNRGYPAALNTGFYSTNARWIANLDSDDLYDPTFIEKAVTAGDRDQADWVRVKFNLFDSTKPAGQQTREFLEPFYGDINFPNAIPYQYTTVNLKDAPDGPFGITDFPGLIARHPCIWAGLMRTEFIHRHNIKLPDNGGVAYQDIPFMADIAVHNPVITVVKECLINYRFEPDQGNSMQAGGKKLIQMGVMSQLAFDKLKEGGLMPALTDAIVAHAVVKNRAPYGRIAAEHKDEYTDVLAKLYLESLQYSDFHNNPYLNPDDKTFIVEIIHDYSVRKANSDILNTLMQLKPTLADIATITQRSIGQSYNGMVDLFRQIEEANH